MDWQLVLVGLGIGFVIGLTGMGGGALLTPVLVLFFGVQPLAAVSSDLVASLVMKPVGAAVHYRRGTVDLRLVKLLCLGSVPAAFCSSLVHANQAFIRTALGIALLLAVAAVLTRGILSRRPARELVLRPVATVLIGVIGGVVVGLTSVGSGTLIIVSLSLLYPGLSPARLVGTDLLQAIPLVGSAALGHLLFGDVHFDVTASILAGALPAVFLGARLSSTARFEFIRPVLLVVLTASALALLHAGYLVLLSVLVLPVWLVGRRAHLREG